MPRFCAACGGQMADNATACPACGKAAGQSAGGGAAAAPATSSGTGVADNVAGLVCYSPIGLFADIFFLVADPYKTNKKIRFHAFQSLFLCGAIVAIEIGLMIIGGILSAVAGPLVLIMVPIYFILMFGIIGLMIFLMYKTYQNQKVTLPVIGALAEKQAG